MIWDGLKKITTADSTFVVYELIRSNIAVYSIHTSLDVITGGVNDGLAEIAKKVEQKLKRVFDAV